MKVADLWERQGRPVDALAAVEGAGPLWDRLGDHQAAARARLGQGRLSEALERRVEAQRAYEAAGKLFRMARDRQGEGDASIRLGALLLKQDRPDGLVLLQAALEDARQRRDVPQQVQALQALGDYRQDQEEAGAQALYKEGLALAEARQDTRAEADLRMRLARFHANRGEHAEALPLARRALGLYQSLKQRRQEADAWALLGHLSLMAGDPSSALEQHERALGLYRALRDQGREAASLLNLAVAYDRQSLKEEAAGLQDKALALLQSLP